MDITAGLCFSFYPLPLPLDSFDLLPLQQLVPNPIQVAPSSHPRLTGRKQRGPREGQKNQHTRIILSIQMQHTQKIVVSWYERQQWAQAAWCETQKKNHSSRKRSGGEDRLAEGGGLKLPKRKQTRRPLSPHRIRGTSCQPPLIQPLAYFYSQEHHFLLQQSEATPLLLYNSPSFEVGPITYCTGSSYNTKASTRTPALAKRKPKTLYTVPAPTKARV